MPDLVHVSDRADIALFAPRPSPHAAAPVVWALERQRLYAYLTPRDCPRVTFRAGPRSKAADIDGFLWGAVAVLAIEASWYERLRTAAVHCYALPADGFVLADEPARYWTCASAVAPRAMTTISDLPGAILGLGVELRIVPSLWPLHDAVAASSLCFSMIRMRNAAARP